MTPAGESPPDLRPAIRDAVLQSRKQFIAAAADARPRLHRFCARMCGTAFDGEDVVQEVLAEAFYNIASLKDPSRFEPWLFRIAYHRCIDFIRPERRRSEDVAFEEEHDVAADAHGYADAFNDTPIDDALAALVIELPPKERASVLLKDVLGYSLEEVAGIADSTLGGVKAALHRAHRGHHGRTRLHILHELHGSEMGVAPGAGHSGWRPGDRTLAEGWRRMATAKRK